ncbi:MAG: sodium/proline symporter [Candidatus Marinimicrobia bacterium]|nr:sodium/proline symporter [Candidatus Neomarinimicrobiota bacterium]
MALIEIIFALYLAVLILVGFFTYKYNKTQEDYLLAGRKLGPWITAFSERASGESAWLLLALPGAVITMGLSVSWSVVGIITGIVASWFLIAEKLREETEKYNALTIPDYLHKRFDDSSNIIRVFSSIIIAFFFLFYVSAQLHASGKILNSLFTINPIIGITIGALIIISYTLLGGFMAVAWTDFFQGFLMVGTLVILPIAGFIELSKSVITISDGWIMAEAIFKNENSSLFGGKKNVEALIVALTGLSWGLGYFGQPHLLIRFMAIKSSKDIKVARRIALSWAFPAVIGAFFVGVVSLLYFGPSYFVTIDPEKAMPLLSKHIMHPILAGLFISGAVSAMMSTADSQLLVSSSAITEGLLFKYKKIMPKNTVTFNRLVVVLIGSIAYCIAIYSEIKGNNIFSIVSYAWSGLGSAFGPVLLMSLWWKKINRNGVIAGIFTGFFTTIVWSNIPFLNELITERLSSFIFSFTAAYVTSLIYHDKN